MKSLALLVAGGAGFIGSTGVRKLVRESSWSLVSLDSLPGAGNLEYVARVAVLDGSYRLERQGAPG